MRNFVKVFHTGGPSRGCWVVGLFNGDTGGYIETLSRHKFARDAEIAAAKRERP